MFFRTISLALLTVMLGVSLVLAGGAEAVITVDRLSCGSCLRTIDGAVSQLEGTDGLSKYDFRSRTLWFNYDDEKLTAEQIAEAITEAGYAATVVESP